VSWPPWWEWQLELTPHLEKRMEDRHFTEVDLRAMLEAATGSRADVMDGRFIIETRYRKGDWEVMSNPTKWSLVVITAYAVDR
jgi:hypothetical protein